VLRVSGLSRSFGGVYAVRDVSLDVADGEVCGIIGPNGAGKSTLFNLVTGHLAADHGEITFLGHRVERVAPHRRARLGMAIVFQAARVFRGMTVRENVMVGMHGRTRAGFVSAALRLPAHRRDEHDIAAAADAALGRVGLLEWADRPADLLPIGQQRALQLARALCARPRLLLLDEPASGLRGQERERLAALVEELRADGLTILLIEHDVGFVTRLADRVVVLDLGQVIADGPPAEIRADPLVLAAYLGQSS
jgi:branched-chain amino acid transport system ATP-binding protein